MRKITIENTKNICRLDFFIPDHNGVYLLVGANGAGKTTLLVCLERICNPIAFARGFISARNIREVDQYENASITYTTGDICVRFRKKTAKWAPTPKKESRVLLTSFGFPQAIFIRADSKRIDITQEEIRTGDFVRADTSIKAALNSLFETRRYSQLFRLRNANGRGRPASYFYVIKDGDKYYSEKRFSSGELALLRLVENIQLVAENSLILLDEAEMALHPRVQKNLLDYLRQKATEKNLLVIVSTHSSSLIKSTPKNNIILLHEEAHGIMQSITPCYPATAIGCVDFEENTIFDFIFFVEDDMARLLLKKMVNHYIRIVPAHATAMTSIVPVGGYEQTALMAVNTRQQIFTQSKVFAVLDEDAFNEGMGNPVFRDLYNNNRQIIKNLGCTPELWIIDQLEAGESSLQRAVRERFHCEIRTILEDIQYLGCNSPKPRKRAKAKVDIMVSILMRCSGDSEQIVIDALLQILADSIPESQIRAIIAPMMNIAGR